MQKYLEQSLEGFDDMIKIMIEHLLYAKQQIVC